ncbi:hypothetical protein TIFTF001_001580 [Ficus carica]|uniref:X8 domain-containing protein n=1 Tax=Ficus carica TaxID=3494 RepID=A0AA88CQN6_FICCA|nr:hypothetical protein TIFTF001_001580 [Ficus carica]
MGGVEKEHYLIKNTGQPLELSSPFSLPPFDSLSPQNSPLPFFVYPPSSPPNFPLPPGPTTPQYGPSPPTHSLSPPKPSPSPPTYLPPPRLPLRPPPPPDHKRPQFAVWCVAKPTVPDSILQQALDYACGSGADCKSIEPNGPCYQPNTLLVHASYAFNSYFQNRKLTGGTCDFGGTAMLVTDDPMRYWYGLMCYIKMWYHR